MLHPALRRKACGRVRQAAADYGMFQPGERVLVGVSGRDSLVLAHLLREAFPDLRLDAVHLDPGFSPDMPAVEPLRRTLAPWGIELEVISTNFVERINASPKRACFTCSRARKQRLLELAEQRGIATIALGHHEDDIAETLLLNILYCREVSAMRPRQPLFGGRFHTVRPLSYLGRRDVAKLVSALRIPLIPHDCPHGSGSERQRIRDFLRETSRRHPGVAHNAFLAMGNVKAEFLPRRPGYLDAEKEAEAAPEEVDG